MAPLDLRTHRAVADDDLFLDSLDESVAVAREAVHDVTDQTELTELLLRDAVRAAPFSLMKNGRRRYENHS